MSRIYSAAERAGQSASPNPNDKTGLITPPWQLVTTEDVRKVIAGTRLETIVRVLESVTSPPLPLEMTLPKAITLCGAALAQPKDDYDSASETESRHGVDLAKFVINTARGQVCNIWSLIVSPSGTGKDIGNIESDMAFDLGISVGTSGSAEGLCDTFIHKGGGLLTVSEFGPWLDTRHWQHGASSWITAAFNKGYFQVCLSRRNKNSPERKTNYCYPSILANVQPEILSQYASAQIIHSGFLCRFLISSVPQGQFQRPSTATICTEEAFEAICSFRSMCGSLSVPEQYLNDLYKEFADNNAPFPGIWMRYVNEYGPRLAVMLAASNTDLHQKVPVIEQPHWERTAVLIRWFYKMAESVLDGVSDSAEDQRFESMCSRFHQFIKKFPEGVSMTVISRNMHRGTTADYRRKILDELVARGFIEFTGRVYRAIR